jgi:AcrR family transcriptional regulator
MTEKNIKEDRMREYFINAARDILKGEGISALNVRAVAERAGYSYATIYNYFHDVKDLVSECITVFQNECLQSITVLTAKKKPGFERIRAAYLSYVSYFVQYPGVYDIFYIEKLSDTSSREKTGIAIYDFHRSLAEEDWSYCVKQKIITKEQSEEMKTEIVMYTTGMMLHYFNRHYPRTYKEFSKSLGLFFDKILSA